VARYQSQSKPSIQYRENQETLVPYSRSESDSARLLWSDFERDTCLCHPNQTTDRPHLTIECKNLDMNKIHSHLDGEPDRLLAFKRQWLRMHPNAYKSPLVSSISNRRQRSSRPNKPNKKRLFSDDRPSEIDQRRQASIATYAKQRASPKTYGQAITPETVWITPILPERISNENFETTSKVALAEIPTQPRFSSLDDDDLSRSEYCGHCATTAPLTDDTAMLTNTLDASSQADTIPESANKDSENDIAGPDPDSEHVHDSDAIHEFLMDI
jgi:hypothetical protein